MEFTETQQLLQQARTRREKSKELFRLKEKLNKIRREKNRLSRFEGKGRCSEHPSA